MKVCAPGIPDELFLRGDIPMTKQEIRILAVVKAAVKPADIIVDIGAGTGSLSVEAALLAPQGRVYAVEKEAEGVALIRANAAKFTAPNIEVIHGEAPAALDGLPAADVVFVGGSGGRLPEILAAADGLLRPCGRLIATAVTIETLHDVLQAFSSKRDFTTEAVGVQITRLRPAGAKHMFQALNPVYIITGKKGDNHDR
ncbi:MAG TPA: precorrin-6Y C5,15-methyltransferase (decarboxylating) subunit CbiT [Selenomonadales bacterium]|nr:precorrin-6Y C5,15-methyltransferase (decarboxylating) subunit CbiT [Selenomonadales bacterium]